MTKNLYALLVGIDNYDPASTIPIPSLKGCVNDAQAVAAYLQERIAKDGEWNLVEPVDQPWILTNQAATRQAIINGFQHHLSNANSDDVVFFYYAGHGAQENAPEEFWHLESDHLDETLVCYDSRTEGSRDLADKELAYLISKVAQKHPHVLVILDCCHSGSGTRDLPEDVTVRRGPVDVRQRPLNSFIFAEDSTALNEILTSSRSLEKKTTGLVLPRGRHVSFSACRDYELAKEYKGEDGQPRGAFSYFLLQTLQRTNGSLSYRDLARNLNALITGKVKEQSPQVEATDREELNKPFLGGAIPERPYYFSLTHNRNDNSWVIDGGTLHGIQKTADGSDTLLAFFPAGSTPEQLRQLSQALGEARVTQVQPQRSRVEITSSRERLSETESYWAVVTSLPLPPLKVYIKGDSSEASGIELAHQALQTIGPAGQPSLYVRQVDTAKAADYQLLVRGGQYWITQPEDDRPLVAPIPETLSQIGYTTDSASQTIRRLEHIARWHNILQLSTPATSRIKPEDVEMEIIVLSGRQEFSTNHALVSEMRVEYTYENDEWQYPTIRAKLTNKSNKTLYCNILELPENYSVGVPFFDEKSSIRLTPQETDGSVIESSDDLGFVIPEEFLAQGITEYKEIFKLIVSTTEFDASLLEQDGLNPPPPTRSLGEYEGTLNCLMQGVNTRDVVKAKGQYDDWMTQEVTMTLLRPQDARAIGANHSTSLQNGVVEVQPHPSLQAKVNLTTVPQASRDLGNLILPAILRQQPRCTESFQFTTARGSDPGLSALELSDVEDYTVVTPEAPLKLIVETALAPNEHLLPFAYDGEFFLPLGQGIPTESGKTEITLKRLPSPTVSSRSLKGSIKIFFEKVVNQKLGHPFEYPILAIAEVDQDGNVTYEKNQENIRTQIAQAKRLVLYIHGIIGDTQSMVPSAQKAIVEIAEQRQPIQEFYDLILTFDYENIQTTIEENAQLLGQRLQAVGLEPNHGKELHIIAHSMGGLVSRWFIEREGGNLVVQHLVMLGTPNAGSPWPTVQDWAFTALSFSLNRLSVLIWPTKIVVDLLEFLEANDYSLDQMQPDSPFLKQLAENPDPHIPYTIIAGDRSIVPIASVFQVDKQSSPLQRLMQKLFGKAVDRVVDLAFFHQPNDIAVTLTSIKSVSANRLPQPKILLPDTACDHLTYFTHPAGLDALALALHQHLNPNLQRPVEASPPSGVEHNLNINSQNALNITEMVIPESEQNITPNPIPDSNVVTNPLQTQSETRNPPRKNNLIIGLLVLLALAIFGLIVWHNSQQQPRHQNQNKTGQI